MINSKKLSIDRLKAIVGLIQSLLTVTAIVSAAIWFFLQREGIEKANISHNVIHQKIHEQWRLIRTEINIENIGKRKIKINSGLVRIHKIFPLTDKIVARLKNNEKIIPEGNTVIDWPRIGNSSDTILFTEILPGEVDILYYDFVVPSDIQIIEVYSYYEREVSPSLGWTHLSIHNLTIK